MQIPTNPRIASGLALGVAKSDKENSTVNVAPKPTYVSVLVPKLSSKSSQEDTNSMIKNDAQRAINQSLMKEMITKASANGTLFTKNWDMEPLFPLPIDSDEQINLQSSDLLSFLSKSKSSGRRTKSRWELVPEEKLVEKTEPVTNDFAKVVSLSHPEATERAMLRLLQQLMRLQGLRIGLKPSLTHFFVPYNSPRKMRSLLNKSLCLICHN